jgi:hypothetical protein
MVPTASFGTIPSIDLGAYMPPLGCVLGVQMSLRQRYAPAFFRQLDERIFQNVDAVLHRNEVGDLGIVENQRHFCSDPPIVIA